MNTDDMRRAQQAQVNDEAGPRQELEEKYGDVWDTQEMSAEFVVQGFGAPYVVVTRKSDGVKGSLTFQHSPRFYFDFKEA
mgnify:CR=1 FL=1